MRKNRSLFYEIIYTFISLARGMAVTFVNMWRKKVTLMYPEKRWELPDNYRGIPTLPTDPATGKDKCLACGSCARVCPEQIITIEHEVGEDKKRRLKEFKIDVSRCMFCGLCTEACPTKGLAMSHHYELTSFTKEEMVYNLEKLHELGGQFPAEPEPENTGEDSDKQDEKAVGGEK